MSTSSTVQFINSKFGSLDDLALIDHFITELQEKELPLDLNDNDIIDDDLSDPIEQSISEIEDSLDSLLEAVESATSIEPLEEVESKLNELTSKYGEVQVFKDFKKHLNRLKELMNEKKIFISQEEILKKSDSTLELIDKDLEASVTSTLELSSSIKVSRESFLTISNKSDPSSDLQSKIDEPVQRLDYIIKSIYEKLETSLKDTLHEANFDKIASDNPSSPLIMSTIKSLISQISMLQSASLKESTPTYPESLWIFSSLSQTFNTRFIYHFETNRDTNRIDKPEWFLNYLETHLELRIPVIQKYFVDAFENTPYHDRFFVYEYITTLLTPVREKVRYVMERIISNGNEEKESVRLLAHLIYEVQGFDDRIRNKYMFVPYKNISLKGEEYGYAKQWDGLLGDVLKKEWLEVWLAAEKDFALTRFNEIISNANSWELDYDTYNSQDISTPTKSALSFKYLLEVITDRYSFLMNMKYQLRFLMDIQINLLDLYLKKLKEGLKAFESMTSTYTKTVGRLSEEDIALVKGVNGIERLCRIYNSSDFIIGAMSEWGTSLFFVALWEDVKIKANENRRKRWANENGIKLDRERADIYEETSDKLMSREEGGLFDEMIQHYKQLKQKCMDDLIWFLKKEFSSSMKRYFKLNDWSQISSEKQMIPSAELSSALQTLSIEMNFIRKCSSSIMNALIGHKIANEVTVYFENYIVFANRFSLFGAKQLQLDIQTLWNALNLPKVKSYHRLIVMTEVLEGSEESYETKMLRPEEITSLAGRRTQQFQTQAL